MKYAVAPADSLKALLAAVGRVERFAENRVHPQTPQITFFDACMREAAQVHEMDSFKQIKWVSIALFSKINHATSSTH